MTDEQAALVAIRGRQQATTMEDAKKKARVALRNATKIERGKLRKENTRLTEHLKVHIANSDAAIEEDFYFGAVHAAQGNRLAGQIAATDVMG